MHLLPLDFDQLFTEAVAIVARVDDDDEAVRRDRHLIGFPGVVEAVVAHAALDDVIVFSGGRRMGDNPGRSGITLPGFFRRTKRWDCVVVHRPTRVLVAALELKSMNREAGKNIHNRVEELVGLGVDFQRAAKAGLFQPARALSLLPPYEPQRGAAADRTTPPPFAGYLMVFADDSSVTRDTVGPEHGHYQPDRDFDGLSNSARVAAALSRSVSNGHFDSACVIIRQTDGGYRRQAPSVSPRQFFGALADRVAEFAAALIDLPK